SDKDLVEYNPINTNANIYFDGDATTLSEDITAVHVLENGHIVMAAKGNTTLGGLSFTPADLIEYDSGTDTAILYFAGSSLFDDPGERIVSAHIYGDSGPDVAAEGFLAHWKLDDGAGPTAVDSVGSHDGTLTSGPVWVTGQLGGALDFDGVNDYVDAGAFDVSGSGLTTMGWFNADSLPATTDPRIVSKASSTAEADAWWQLSILTSASDANIRLRTKAGGTTSTLIDSSTNLNPGQWYFAVGTYNAATGQMKLYLDGTEVASQLHPAGGAIDTNPTVPVAIGANGTAEQFFDGVLDDVRVYNRALNATEIADLFTAGGGVGGGGGGPTIFEVRVATGNDDAEQRVSSGSVNLTSSDLELIADGSNDQLVGMRFTNVTVPNGATISSAYTQFQVDETNSGATNINIQGQAIDDAPTFTTGNSNISSRSRTSASVAWAPVAWTTVGEAGPDQRTPDLKSVIQEIVNRPGWTSGNDIVIIITGSGERTAESYNGSSSGAAMLHVEY
ncbi:MAG: LamG domain-containing protein, partial [Woeseiaceae bacterium]